ncbi:hypothetical protein fugu_015597 [Takifugu bimaculatus]|uniref:Uncharacterized protein n=1 Tax=Takifugu bimaculatus TaxID=433685 RepID=A0A4Z2BZ36_9TELE|nr:hypothetical protein fugu_015597 [Takifugu bimaculatus]
MGESTRPQIKTRYFLRYTPAWLHGARCGCQQQKGSTRIPSSQLQPNISPLLRPPALWTEPRTHRLPEAVAKRKPQSQDRAPSQAEESRRGRENGIMIMDDSQPY